ncbi:conserved hypothetical protein [Culex quinquefasciatus]|uniref:Uncharacterized protein n=1 Tax=Culex quinquefasciatus TaxID=7176 RepID=B0XEU8_CULQU|nr:conserved hypothetical protein [Culex quinquefasciatus]|eukprot:XP_001868170.1 conserved hypothetical protein [Culex quinquefasciatus]
MVNSTVTTPSQSHGGALYYVVEVPRDEYLKQCAAQAQAAANAGGYPNPAYAAQYAAHHQQFQNVQKTTILARLNSTESGWDNPFRPGGDLSREADEIVNLIKVSNQVIPGPQSASHVVIDEKKKKKCACCVIQ